MMQSAGIGNSVNALASLSQLYNLPLVLLISYRGTPGEKVGARNMAKVTKDILETLRFNITLFIIKRFR